MWAVAVVLLISGSTRAASSNTALLRTAAVLEPERTAWGVDLKTLPAFDPDDDRDPLPPAVAALRSGLAVTDAVLFCTPEYAGALPGAFKNLLDWTVGGAEMPDRPVGWINAASVASPSGGTGAHTELATVLGYVGARVVDDACRRVPLTRDLVGADGLVADDDVRAEVRAALDALLL
jgi:chromate reductase, NAD(P)H dehydrogenase (quinone)